MRLGLAFPDVVRPEAACYCFLMVESLHLDVPPERVRPLRRREYDRLVADGAFADECLELLRGQIISMSPQGARHAAVIRKLNMLLAPALAGRADVQIQSPLALSDESEPEPDVAVVDPGDYADDHPHTAHLVIEVAESSQDTDRNVKTPLYAAAGIAEYWIVDVPAQHVEVYLEPAGTLYQRKATYRREDTIQPARYPELTVPVADILP